MVVLAVACATHRYQLWRHMPACLCIILCFHSTQLRSYWYIQVCIYVIHVSKYNSAKCTIYTHTFSFKRNVPHLLLLLFDRGELFWPANLWNYEHWKNQSSPCLVQCALVRLHGRHKKICGRYENWKLRIIIWNVAALCIGIKVQLAIREPFSPSKVQFLHSWAMHYRLHSANSFDFSHETIVYYLCQLQPKYIACCVNYSHNTSAVSSNLLWQLHSSGKGDKGEYNIIHPKQNKQKIGTWFSCDK